MGCGIRIKELRIGKGWSQGELAKRTGLNRITIARFETNKRIPSLGSLAKLSNAFGCEIEDIIPDLVEKVKADLQSRGVAV